MFLRHGFAVTTSDSAAGWGAQPGTCADKVAALVEPAAPALARAHGARPHARTRARLPWSHPLGKGVFARARSLSSPMGKALLARSSGHLASLEPASRGAL